MRKAEYLALPEVAAFSNWLHVNGARIHFVYNGPRHTMNACGIGGAAGAYAWNGQALAVATANLIGLRTALRLTLSAGHSAAHRHECVAVLHWGRVVKTNDSFYQARHAANNLIAYHQAAHGPTGWYQPANADDALAPTHCLRISAGTTKVHSLLEDELVIYDSRVAAAMGWLVERYCDEVGLTAVPPSLQFCLPAPRPGTHRNPGATRPARFQGRASYSIVNATNPGNWVRDSLRSSWILSGLLDVRDCDPTTRALEFLHLQLGLFMIGYDLRNHRVNGCP